MSLDQLKDSMLHVWLQLKEEEFKELGYDQVSISDLLTYCINFLWKKESPSCYSQIVEDIMNISPNDYFTYASLDALVYSVEPLSEMQLDDLLD